MQPQTRSPGRPQLASWSLLGAAIGLMVNQLGLWLALDPIATTGQLAMSALATLTVFWGTTGVTRVLGTLGMLGCFAGDLAPRFLDQADLAMIGAFAVGQVFLVAAFWRFVDWFAPRTLVVGTLVVAHAVGLMLFLSLSPEVPKGLLSAMAGYAVLLVLMAITASTNRIGTIGGLAFVASDTTLALRMLGVAPGSVALSSALMALYGVALLCLALALVLVSQRAPRRQRPATHKG
ncbi:lysoplasmalogenase family protein [Propionibacteriaceae bacterium G57]|uniref:lysoplasmalogenase family protein n=1 Tax=Aestuariimicrobium sp. G57 TaxID=3418485 RepID=UPI003DA738A8